MSGTSVSRSYIFYILHLNVLKLDRLYRLTKCFLLSASLIKLCFIYQIHRLFTKRHADVERCCIVWMVTHSLDKIIHILTLFTLLPQAYCFTAMNRVNFFESFHEKGAKNWCIFSIWSSGNIPKHICSINHFEAASLILSIHSIYSGLTNYY